MVHIDVQRVHVMFLMTKGMTRYIGNRVRRAFNFKKGNQMYMIYGEIIRNNYKYNTYNTCEHYLIYCYFQEKMPQIKTVLCIESLVFPSLKLKKI